MNPPKTLTTEQCEQLLSHFTRKPGTHTQNLRNLRNCAMTVVMLEAGLRVGEACALKIDDLWFNGNPVSTLIVRAAIAKNKQERHIPISATLADTIKLMRTAIWKGAVLSYNTFAFWGPDPYQPLTTRTVERFILAAGRDALHVDLTPHVLRHTFASRIMRKTNARVVQALLGHRNLQSTQIYMHPNSDDLRKAIDS